MTSVQLDQSRIISTQGISAAVSPKPTRVELAKEKLLTTKGVSVAPSPEQLRAGAHTDYGSLTIVHTNTAVGGLEVQDQSGAWSLVPIVPGTFVVNLGDLMGEWTNDRWVSTMHRVANPPRDKADQAKTSLLFFHQPNYDAVVECVPTCTDAANPPRYTKTTSGEHVTAKINKHREIP